MQETQVQSLGREDPLEMGMAIHSSILAKIILWIEEPGKLQSMGYKEQDMTEQLLHFMCLYLVSYFSSYFEIQLVVKTHILTGTPF